MKLTVILIALSAFVAGAAADEATPAETVTDSHRPTCSRHRRWSYVGCIAEGTMGSRRALTGPAFSQSNMTPRICKSLCKGYTYAGVEDSSQCFCGNTLTNNGATGDTIDPSMCDHPCAGDPSKECGGDWALSLYKSRHSNQPSPTPFPAPLPSPFPTSPTSGYVGCVAEGTTGSRRSLTGPSLIRWNMTPAMCKSFCEDFEYAGVEYGSECYCGNTLTNNGATGALIDPSRCGRNCAGDASQKCGGDWALSLYRTSRSAPAPPLAPPEQPTLSGLSYVGCVAEGVTGNRRSLTGASFTRPNMTPTVCALLCERFEYAGVEYGSECYCGNTLTDNGATGALIDPSRCNRNCAGDASQKCGGDWALSLYRTGRSSPAPLPAPLPVPLPAPLPPPTSSYVGCVAEGVTGNRRSLTGASFNRPDMTPAVCRSLCEGFEYAGVEYGSECYCGNTLTNNGATGAIIDPSRCSRNCAGDATQKCGGDWALSLYRTGRSSPAPLPAPPPVPLPAPPPPPTSSYVGCVAEGVTGNRRSLTGASFRRPNMTPAVCKSLCVGFQYAGVEYGSECYCGNTLTNNGATGAPIDPGRCNRNCAGDASQKCGGDWTLSLYKTDGWTPAPPITQPAPVPAPSTYSYVGCVAEGTTGSRRSLTGASFKKPDMTPAVCKSLCKGFEYAGVEFSAECYCGNSLTNNGATGAVIDSRKCDHKCAGDPSQICGGPWALSLYKADGQTPVPATSPISDYIGCVAEGTTGNRRSLTGPSFTQKDMTPVVCKSLCKDFEYAGVEYSSYCFCGNSLTNNGATGAVIDPSNCNNACTGDPSQKCGGPWTLSLYRTGRVTSAPPTPPLSDYIGCVAEGTIGDRRCLTGASFTQQDMSPAVCKSLCKGYEYAGVEYGNQCFCGNTLTSNGATGATIDAKNCGYDCAGDPSQKCGGFWTLSVYRTGGPLISISL